MARFEKDFDMSPAASTARARTGYAGELREPDPGGYLLGHRLYLPALRRFASPDTLSPFDAGGINRYAYCGGDPINRIDPSGNAWWDWLGLALGVVGAAVGTVMTGGALLGVLGAAAAGSITAAVSTPTLVAMAASATLDVVSIAADVGSAVAMGTGDTSAAGILGWVGLGVGAASGAVSGFGKVAVRTPRARGGSSRLWPGGLMTTPDSFSIHRDYRRTTWTTSDGQRRINVYTGGGAVRKRVEKRAVAKGTGPVTDIKVHWEVYKNRSGGMNYVTDIAVSSREAMQVAYRIADNGGKDVKYLTGVHGVASGNNWSGRTRAHAHAKFYQEDLGLKAALASTAGVDPQRFEIIDIAGMWKSDFEALVQCNAHIVHAYCCSCADPVLMKQLGLTEATVFTL